MEGLVRYYVFGTSFIGTGTVLYGIAMFLRSIPA